MKPIKENRFEKFVNKHPILTFFLIVSGVVICVVGPYYFALGGK